jgi:hypothetical protein
VAKRNSRCLILALLSACSIAALLAPSLVCAQAPERAIEFEDLGLTRRLDLSARAAGLSSFAAVAGDVTALVYNPAGLCRIKSRSPLLGVAHESQEVVTSYGDGSIGLSSNRDGLQFVGGALAIPTFQGSLVPAVAVYPVVVSDADLGYQENNTADARANEFRLEQAGSTYAFALGFGIDLASVLSAGLSANFFEGGYHALRQSHSRDESQALAVDRYVIDDIDGDLDGIGGRFGVMLYAHRHVHIGVNVTLPTLVDGATHETQEVTEVVENSTGSTERSTIQTSSEYIIPYRVDGSIAIPWGAWLVAVECGTCDWSQAAIDNHRLLLQNGNSVLGRTTDYRAGVEWTAPAWPLRVRAGVARLPFALHYLQANRIDNDRLEQVLTDSAPLRFSFGAGIAFKHTILIDAAFTHTRGDRRTTSFSEERTSTQLLIEGSYWF